MATRHLEKTSTFARALRAVMEINDWNQMKLANEIGYAESAVSRWLNGWGARQSTVDTVASRLGYTPVEFLQLAGQEKEEFPPRVIEIARRAAALPEAQQNALLSWLTSMHPLEAMNELAAAREPELAPAV